MKQSWSLLIVLLCLAAPALVGQTSNWTRVQGLVTGENVQVLLDGGETVTGILEQATAAHLTVKREHGDTQVARWAVRRVWILEKRSRLKRVILGALIGFGGGCAIGAGRAGQFTDMNNPPASTRTQMCFALGAFTGAAGAGVGAAIPSARRMLIYRAAEPE